MPLTMAQHRRDEMEDEQKKSTNECKADASFFALQCIFIQ